MIDCECGERVLFGFALGSSPEEQASAWRSTLADVARRLDIGLIWGDEHAPCPWCGTPMSRVLATRR